MILWIIGHWGSCNMGDKYQPYVIANSFLKDFGLFGDWNQPKNIYFVNFSDSGNMYFEIKNIKYTIHGPNSEIPKADIAILTTGSMDHFSPYIPWLKNYLESKIINKLIIWGGFNRAVYTFQDFSENMSFLKNKNIIFIARSERDLKLYEEISNNTGILGGDPMCYWSTQEGIDFGKTIFDEEYINVENKTIVIPSIYCFVHNSTYWEELCSNADIIICIDSMSDKNIIEKYNNKSYIITYPWIFADMIKNAKQTINGRLHSFVISACVKTPTTVIVSDAKPPGLGTFKFEALCNTGAGHNKPLANILLKYEDKVENIVTNPPNINKYNENIDLYLKLTFTSLNFIKTIINFYS